MQKGQGILIILGISKKNGHLLASASILPIKQIYLTPRPPIQGKGSTCPTLWAPMRISTPKFAKCFFAMRTSPFEVLRGKVTRTPQ